MTDKGIPLLIAVLGLATAVATFLGIRAKQDADELESANVELERENGSLVEVNNSLTVRVDDLTEELEEAEAALEDNESPDRPTTNPTGDEDQPSTGSTPASPRDSSIFRETGGSPLTFSSGYSVDLDTRNADWGIDEGSGGDLYFYVGSSGPYLSTKEVSLVDHIPTEAECDDATVLQPALARDQLQVGVQMCMRTSDDRFSYVHVANIDEDNGTITVDIIVWD